MTNKALSVAAIVAVSLISVILCLAGADTLPASAGAAPITSSPTLTAYDPTSPTVPIRLIFIHHSTGQNWLDDYNGELGLALRDNNYFVSDTNYGWGPADQDRGGAIGDHTDIPDWYSWFTGPHRNTYLAALYAESGQHSSYSRLDIAPPGGENRIVMFKSCFPNSNLGGNPDDPPATSADYTSELTVANAKRIYLDLLDYFVTRPDKLFVVIAAPPLVEGATSPDNAANARAFNNWLVNDWLAGYSYNNVAVFDFYTVLTSNGGDADTNDLGWSTGNHHRYRNGVIEHIADQGSNYLAYPTGDSHPSQAGNLKATGEFVPLLNIAYHRWQAGSSTKTVSTPTPSNGQVVTFTIVIRGLAAPLTATAYLTDVVAAGLSYVPGTLTASSGTFTPTGSILRWSGNLSPTPVVTVSYAATVVTTTRTRISISSNLNVPGYQSLTLDAVIIANGYGLYMPITLR
jgi:uncharacterized repeat protein (TIGR01451 family)